MNYYNSSEWDHDKWVEHFNNVNLLKNSKKSIPYEITVSHEYLPEVALGQPTASPVTPPPKEQQWAYFITWCFPTNQKFTIKHLEPHAHISRIVFKPIKYGECTQDEQYHWIIHILNKHINLICDRYDLFFEQTQAGNIHVHGRISFDGKKKTMKDIKALSHRIFGVPLGCNAFCDVKVYESDKWNNYDKKVKKEYQTLEYEHFKNI